MMTWYVAAIIVIALIVTVGLQKSLRNAQRRRDIRRRAMMLLASRRAQEIIRSGIVPAFKQMNFATREAEAALGRFNEKYRELDRRFPAGK